MFVTAWKKEMSEYEEVKSKKEKQEPYDDEQQSKYENESEGHYVQIQI